MQVLTGSFTMDEVLLEAIGDVDQNERTARGDYVLKNGLFPNCREVDSWIQYFTDTGVRRKKTFAVYHTSLSIATWNVETNPVYQIIHKRHVNACYTMEYSPYCLEAMRSSMSLECITHTPKKVIEYITKAREEDKTSLIRFLSEQSPSECRVQILEHAKCHRKVTLNEAFYRIDPDLKLSETDLDVCFIEARFPEKRKLVFSKVDIGGIKIHGKDGLYKKKQDMIDKYSSRTRQV